jgi:OFA family oxalate/formate antiporter-like MFS transporter
MIYDRSGSYISIFFIMLGAVMLGTVCTLLIRKPEKKNAEGCK